MRFAREAKAVGALTHLHTGSLYDVGRHDDIDFLVMECLEGWRLAARLARKGGSRSTRRLHARLISPAPWITRMLTGSSTAT